MTGGRVPAPLTPGDRDLLLGLLGLPTAGPLETGPDAPPPRLAEAQRAYGRHAAAMGLRAVRHAPADPADLAAGPVPAPVREALAWPGFLAGQPSLVLRLGPDDLPAARTVMFNVHLDTVAGMEPARFDGERFHGRGAIDAKGPAVALLAGIRDACARRPALGRDVGVLVQAVAGEEGGAMGVFGTRPLVRRGFTGRLNVFCEPTGGRFLPRSTASMTARIVVDGADAVDDRPGAGHNASVLLGFLAQHLGRALDPVASEAAVCVAGLHTGTRHNKVYGSGSLLLNIGYASPEVAHRVEGRLRDALDEGLKEFASVFAGTALFGRTAADARVITRLEWPKRGLPVLDDRPARGSGKGCAVNPDEDGPKCAVPATVVKVLAHRRTDRGMRLEPFASRCVRAGEVHELVATDHAETAPGARIDRVAFLGFAEIGGAGVLDRGDELWVGGRRLGVLLGFDGCHLPNHYNVLVRAEPARTGTELGLLPGERLVFRQGAPAR